MKLGDYVTRRVVGYLAIIATAAVLSMLGIGNARAQANACSSAASVDSDNCDTGEQAHAAGMASMNAWIAENYGASAHLIIACAVEETNSSDLWAWRIRAHQASQGCSGTPLSKQKLRYFPSGNRCPLGKTWNPITKTCEVACSARPAQQRLRVPPSGTKECNNGCWATYRPNGDDETSTVTFDGGPVGQCERKKEECEGLAGNYIWNPYQGYCQPVNPDCPAGQQAVLGVCQRKEECPSGMKLSAKGECEQEAPQCPAGKVKGPDGSCADKPCPPGQVKGPDGTCKPDTDDDGEEDENPDNKKTFSGGDDCNTPPACSGDAILCGQARIQWRIECNTRKNRNISGGHCQHEPICTGEKCDALEYASLLQQWRTACHLERLLARSPGGTGGGDDTNILDALGEQAASLNQSDGDPGRDASAIWGSEGGSDYTPNESGLGFGSSCPAPPQISGMTLDWSGMCTIATWIGLLVLAMAHLHALYIFMGD